MWGQKLKSGQAKAKLSIAPQSNTTPTVTLAKAILLIIPWVMNHINSLSAISLYVGGCECMPLVRVSLITGLLITGLDWTGLDWNPKICFYALWDAISIK